MSIEQFRNFIQKVDEDESIREKVKSFDPNNSEELVSYAKSLGFEFSMQDMLDAVKEAGINPSESELSEDQLEQVAGGAFITGGIFQNLTQTVITIMPPMTMPTVTQPKPKPKW